MIKLLRIDHRLLHGQVAVAWFNSLDVDTIFVVNDEVARDELRKSALRLAKPENAKLVMKSVQDAIESINSGITDKYKMLVVVESVTDAKNLIDGTRYKILSLNLGGTKKREGTHNYSAAINLTDSEVEQLHELSTKGVEVFIQQVPSEKKQNFN